MIKTGKFYRLVIAILLLAAAMFIYLAKNYEVKRPNNRKRFKYFF